MKNAFTKFAAPVVGIALTLGGIQQANAATISDSQTLTSSKTDVNYVFNLLKFDPSLGTLQSVTLELSTGVTTTITVTNTGVVSSEGSARTEILYYLSDPEKYLLTTNGKSPTEANPNNGYKNTIDQLTDAQDYILSPGASLTLPTSSNNSASSSKTYTTAADELILGEFTGSGTISLTLQTYTTSVTSNSGGNTAGSQETYVDSKVTVTYTYIPAESVPESSTWAMMLGGVGMLAIGQRFRKSFN